MSRQDIQKLLGGYATGTLTPGEQQALFEAALEDQEVFDALAREQALRDLLRDPASKARLLAALDEAPARWYQRIGRWYQPREWWRPAAAAMAMAAIAITVITVRHGRSPEMVITAQVSQSAAPKPMLDRGAEAVTVDGQPAEAKRAPANPAPASRQEELKQRADPGAGGAEKRRADLPAINDNLRAEESKTKASLAKEAEVDAVGSVAPAVPRPPRPATVASGFRDNAPAGAVGGAAAPAPPPSPEAPPARRAATEESAAVQAGAAASNSVYVLSARELFYGAPQARAFTQAQQQLSQQLSQQQPGPQQQAQQGRTAPVAMAPAKALRAPQPANLGVRYRFVRKANNDYLDVDSKSLKAGDTVMLEFTPNDSGELMVTSGDRRIAARSVQRLAPYVVGPLDPNDKELSVVFTRAGTVTITGAAAFASRKKDEANADSLHRADADGAVYVVGEPAAQQVRFTIPLNYK